MNVSAAVLSARSHAGARAPTCFSPHPSISPGRAWDVMSQPQIGEVYWKHPQPAWQAGSVSPSLHRGEGQLRRCGGPSRGPPETLRPDLWHMSMSHGRGELSLHVRPCQRVS